MGVEVHPVDFHTSYGQIIYRSFGKLLVKKNLVVSEMLTILMVKQLLMFDATARLTYKRVPNWFRAITRVCENLDAMIEGKEKQRKTSIS